MSDFAAIEVLFQDLLDATASELSSTERSEVQHFIDVGEYGLALESAVEILLERKGRIGPTVFPLAAALAKSMSLEMSPSLGELERRSMNEQ